MNKIGFDNEKYLTLQTARIRERINQFGGKLYLEFGGKLFDDYHASRVLPGFEPDSKVRMLWQLREQAEILIAVNASDIEKNKVRGDLGITYDQEVLRLIDAFRLMGLYVSSVVLTQYSAQSAAEAFQQHLEHLGLRVYRHYPIPGYPNDIATIVSPDGYGRNEYVETTRSLVVITGPGPGSGKMATCLSQLYHDHLHGVQAGYAKFETFPIWNLPLKHPVNMAYEAATADLNDVNVIDPFHLDAYGTKAVNYNRDVDIFPVLNEIFRNIYGSSPYKSPTDMGVNMAGFCITDEDAVCRASCQEIIRRYYASACTARKNDTDKAETLKIQVLMNALGISANDRPVVSAALTRAAQTGGPCAALELPDGTVVTGKTSPLLGATSAVLINALKALGGLDKELHLISPQILEPVRDLKINHLGNHNPRLHTNEVLLALSICAATDPQAEIAMQQLEKLHGCELHSTVLLSQADDNTLRKLGVNVTCEPVYESKKLYHKK